MIIFLKKSQFALFDAPVRVAQHVRKDGTVVAPHTRVQKVRGQHPPSHHQAQGDLFGDAAPRQHQLFAEQEAKQAIEQAKKPERESRGPAASDAWVNEGKSADELIRDKAHRLGAELAGIITEEASEKDFAPTELPKVIAQWASENKVPADELRQAVLASLGRYDLSEGRKAQIRRALDPTAKKPAANGAGFGTLYHGTPKPFDAFRDPTGSADRGAGYNHQGPAVYLTDDPHGYARFFAREGGAKLAYQLQREGKKDEAAQAFSGWGHVLSVKLADDARILELDKAPAEVKDLFERSVGHPEVGQKLREVVLALGYAGLAFTEPNHPEGWPTKAGARTVAVYRQDKAIITGDKPAAEYDPKKKPAPTTQDAIDELAAKVTRYASGLSRAKDFEAAGHGSHPVGVDVGQLSDKAMDQLADLVTRLHTPVFVDSGAYSLFRSREKRQAAGEDVEPLDFSQVLERYDQLTDKIGEKNEAEEDLPKPILVMPDVMGDQAASLDEIKKHAKWINVECSFDVARPLIAMPKGDMSLTAYYDAVVEAIGTSRFIVGIPAVSGAWTPEQVTAFLREREPARVHFLGALHESRLNKWLAAVVESGHQPEITADANPLRSQVLPRDGTKLAPGERAKKITDKLGKPARAQELKRVIEQHGGEDGVRRMLAGADFEQQQRFIGLISDLSGKPQIEVRHQYGLGDGPVEGDRKVENGVTYVLRNGRWHRAGDDAAAVAPAPAAADTGADRLVLVACGAAKKDGAHSARQLYTGALAGVLNKHLRPGSADVAIISAKHGLVHGDQVIESYDQRMTPERAKELAAQPVDLSRFHGKRYREVFIAGGADYRAVGAAYVKQLQDAGIVAADAKVDATSGGIGEIRGQLGAYLRSLTDDKLDPNQVLFHGTGADFSKFNGPAYFTINRGVAEDSARATAEAYGGNARVISARLSLRNPAIVSADEIEGLKYDDAAMRRLREAGHDGAMRADLQEVLAFDPSSIETVGSEPLSLPGPTRAITQDELRAAAERAPHNRAAPFGVPAGISKGARRDINARVAQLVADGQVDRELMRQYSGNGGCGDSLNEYYTDPAVARAMWDTIGRLGLTHGTALEPSCGTGVFLHTAPAGFRVTGVELDPVSSACATALHGDRHEVHTASLERFATADNRQFDVVIGNPPYGPRGFLAKDDKVGISTAEAYFTDTALDKCKPGGIVALVVPTGIMDSRTNLALRRELLRKGQFLGAQRMPNTAFEHSHTEVTTDVVFLRKRPDDVAGALTLADDETLQKLGVWDEEFLAGTYFTGRGAHNVLGTMEAGWRAKAGMGNDITVNGSMQGVPEAIAEFVPDPASAAPGELTVQQVVEALPEHERDRALLAASRLPYANTAKVGDTKVVDGVQYVLQGDPPRWHRVDEFMASSAITDAGPLAAEIDRAFRGEAFDRPQLEADIKAYIAKHGIPANNPELMIAASVDKQLFRLIGAVDRKGELSDLVAGRAPRKVEGSFEANAELLALETEQAFTAEQLAERTGQPVDEVAERLAADSSFALLPDGRWTTMAVYLTGELWPKLDAAREQIAAGHPLAEKLKAQAQRLEETIDPASLDDVDVKINHAFLPLHVVEAYFNWRQFDSDTANEWTRKQQPVKITFDSGVYKVEGGNTWGGSKLLEKYLNRAGVKKEKEKPEIDAWNEQFKQWLCASTYRDAVEDLYNRKFRGFAPTEYSDAPIDVPGLTTDRDVRSWRWSSLRRSLALGKGIVADDVGLGKTLGGLLLARMAKVDGRAKKPVIVVPKSVLANWFSEAQDWFPGARVLTIGGNFSRNADGELVGKDDNAAERKRKYHDLTQNDYDFVIISEPAFEEVDLSPDKKEAYYSDDFWVQRGEAMGNAGDKRRKRIKEAYEQSLATREFADRTDAIYFDQLGVDMLLADEMHHQKNLYAARARFGDQPKFLGGQGLSNRALDFNLKTRWVRENNGGKGVYGLTATPTKNSPLEIYSMLSHVAPEAFERIGIRNSEEFLDRFCEFTGDKVLSTSGEIEDATVVSGFQNLDELREIMHRFIDRRTAEQVGLKLPTRADRMHLVDMTPKQQEVYAELRELAESAGDKKDATGDAHIFSVMDKMNKAALDLALLDSAHAGAHSPKYHAMAEQVKQGLKDGAQIVFSEYIDSHERLAAALVDAGIPRNRIGIINAQVAGSAVKRQNIAEALNNGKLDVVIGNATMAEGLNMQKRTTDIHHADVPWEPATLQQRNGRGLRQGNNREAVRIHTYLSKGSFDGYRYQAVGAKKDWQDLLWNGGNKVENLAREGKFTKEDLRIMLAADPEAARAAYEADRAAAQQRRDAGERFEFNKEFVRFQELSRSYKGLKNKDTASATRLRQRLEASKTSLFNSRHLKDKSLLDSTTDVLLDPNTGHALHAGVGLDLGAEDGKAVITGVNAKDGTVTLRRYAHTGGGKPVTLPLDKLGELKPFVFDKDAEAAEVRVKLESEAGDKLKDLKKWDDLKTMPSGVVEANADMLQQRIKAGAKDYSFSFPYGSVPMVNRETGKVEMFESYEHSRKHDTHDYLLPTDSAREKLVQGYIDAERGAAIDSRLQGTSGRGKKTWWEAGKKYQGTKYDQQHINPLTHMLNELGGRGASYGEDGPLVKEAKQRLKAEQLQRIASADSAQAVFDELAPLAKPEGRDHKYTMNYPPEAVRAAFDRLKALDALGKPISEGKHSRYAFGIGDHGHSNAAYHALLRVAPGELAADMAEETEQHAPQLNDANVMRRLTAEHNPSKRSLGVIQAAADRHGIRPDVPLSALRHMGLLGNFHVGGNYGYTDWSAQQRGNRTWGEMMTELHGVADRQAAKEAA
jgi:predicted RNA methylase/superfamily II DNA or RNA helicase